MARLRADRCTVEALGARLSATDDRRQSIWWIVLTGVNRSEVVEIAGARVLGEARPDEREIDISGTERTAATDFDARQSTMTTTPACRWPRTAAI